MTPFNHQIKQVMILSILLLMIYLVAKELYVFIPGLFGAVTLYVLSRASYFQMIYFYKWKKGWTAGLYLLGYLLILLVLIYITYRLLQPQVQPFLNEPAVMLDKAKLAIDSIQLKTGIVLISDATLSSIQQKISVLIPSMLNDTANLMLNVALLLFVLYYMLVHGKEMENYLSRLLPLKQNNVHLLAAETKRLVKVSALGIPMISIIQGLTATLGYIIFKLPEPILWGFLTGVFAFFPVIGTMIIYLPLVIYMYATGGTWHATGLLIYSMVVTGNVDYLFRITLLKRMGHVHPLITVLGVIAGLGLFGFIGLIFGPLLVSYIILLFKIYATEFLEHSDSSEVEKPPPVQ